MKTLPRLRAYIAFFCFALVLCISHRSSAQKLDSLRAVLTEYGHDDTNTVNLLVKIAGMYNGINADSVASLASRGLVIAEKNNFATGIGECLHMLGVAYTLRSNYDSSLVFYKRAQEVLHKANQRDQECNTLYAMNVAYYRMGRYDEAIACLEKDILIATQDNNFKRSGRALLAMGDINRDKGNYSESINSYLKALTVYEKNNFIPGKSECYRNTADIYSLIGNSKKALEYVTKANAIYKPGDDIQGVIVNYTSVAGVYGQIKDYKSSLAYYQMALKIADSIHSHYWKGMCLINIGDNNYALENLDSALSSFRAGLAECEITHDRMGAAFAHRGIGNVLVKKGNAKEGTKELLDALEVMKAQGAKREIADISFMLSEGYAQIGNTADAYKYCRISRAYNDTLYSESSDKRIQQLQFDYELKQKEGEITLLQKDKAIKQAKLEKQKAVSWGLISGLVLLVAIICLLYLSRQREKKNKEQSLRQRDEIQAQATKLEELNQFKDKTFSVLSHDLRGPLAAFTGAMALLDEDEISQEEFIALKPEINSKLSSLSLLLDNLLNWAKSYMQGKNATNIKPVDIGRIATENTALVQNAAAKKMVTIHNNVPENTIALADADQLDIVVRNLINNAIKFTNERGRITLTAQTTGNTVAITIADTGVGMTQQQLDKLFKISTGNSTYGTGGEKGTGLGLLLCHEFVKANHGTLTATSEPSKGSVFTITLPAA